MTLWRVAKVRTGLEEAEVRRLWRQGKVTGMFNLTTSEQVAACRDFCVQNEDDETADDELRKLRERVAALAEENLALRERFETERRAWKREKKKQQSSGEAAAATAAKKKELALMRRRAEDAEATAAELRATLKEERQTLRETVLERSRLERELSECRRSADDDDDVEELNRRLLRSLLHGMPVPAAAAAAADTTDTRGEWG